MGEVWLLGEGPVMLAPIIFMIGILLAAIVGLVSACCRKIKRDRQRSRSILEGSQIQASHGGNTDVRFHTIMHSPEVDPKELHQLHKRNTEEQLI